MHIYKSVYKSAVNTSGNPKCKDYNTVAKALPEISVKTWNTYMYICICTGTERLVINGMYTTSRHKFDNILY